MTPHRQLDTLECSAAAFLLLPLLIFFASWLRWPWALALLGLAALSSWAVLRQRQPVSGPPLGPRVSALMAGAALLWVLLSGLLGPLALNTDWFVRLAVLRDLSRGAWPVGYGAVDGGDLMLRFSLGYYVVPALAGKLLGDGAARLALGLCTSLGVLLFFALAVGASTVRRAGPVAAWLLLLIAFSGMDVLGYRVETGL